MIMMVMKMMNTMTVTYKRYKTGNVPPGEYQFEDLSSGSNTPSSSGNAKTRTLSRVKSPETGALLNTTLICFFFHMIFYIFAIIIMLEIVTM